MNRMCRNELLRLGALLSTIVSSTLSLPIQAAEELPFYQQILNHLNTDSDVVLPWMPAGVLDTDTMHNRETPIPPQCYTDSQSQHNPCYVCHQDAIPGRENTKNDHDLQEAYSFSDEGLTNHWFNLFEDRSARVNQISDNEILSYINQDNYSELADRLRAAGFTGWIPDLTNLADGAAAFDAEGFAKDGSWWVAFNYKPLPSTFWPTQGSTDDVMIRLPPEFYKTAQGTVSREVYKANLALLEANIKGVDRISSLPLDETQFGTDVNGDGQLGLVEDVAKRSTYIGAASSVEVIPHVYPMGTEFLHTVRYVGVDAQGQIINPKRMKEVRYMKRRIQSRHFQLAHYYEEENLEKEQGSLPSYKNFGHEGLSSNFGWNITGFIENKQGRLRWNTFEENVFCMGCHTTIGSTIDKTFSFPRKVDGRAGWGYINLRGMADAANKGETLNEVATYLSRVGGGTEFRSNPELEARFYYPNGSLNTVELASARDVYELVTPSASRALQLNKAYKAIVEEQDFIFGRDATATPPKRVLSSIDNETSPTLPPERQYSWNIVLDWDNTAANGCNYKGDVDFGPLSTPHLVVLGGTGASQFKQVCAGGHAKLAGTLKIELKPGFQPKAGDQFDIIKAGLISGDFSQVELPTLNAAIWKRINTGTGVSFKVEADRDADGVADHEDNCSQEANGPAKPDLGGHSQRDTDGDGFGNLCDTDLNNDGISNGLDAGLFRAAVGSRNGNADFNGDGIVNAMDTGVFRSKIGTEPGPARQ